MARASSLLTSIMLAPGANALKTVDAVKAQPTIVTTGANVFARFARLAHPYGLTSCSPTS